MKPGGVADSDWIEVGGRTVVEATEVGLQRLGLGSVDDAEVEVLDEPQRGLLGVLGGRGARVRMRPRTDKSEALEALVREILRVLGLSSTGMGLARDVEGFLHVDLTGPGLGGVIGRRGETLDALQYLLNLAIARLPGPPTRVVLDAGGYRARRRTILERLAKRIVELVRRTGQEVALEPMSPHERKIIHMAVAAEGGVGSESRGQEPFRRVVVRPGDVAAPADEEGTAHETDGERR